MSVDPTLLTSSYDNVDRASYTTASINPTANRWLVIDIENSIGSGTAGIPSFSGLGLSWTQEATDVDGARRATRFYAWTGSPAPSGALTIDFGADTHNGCAWIVYELGADVDTSDPFVQSVTTILSSSVSDVTVTLAAYGSGDNRPLICATHAANEGSTPEAGYTEIADVSGASPSVGFAAAYHSSATDTSPSYSWATATGVGVAIASEIKAGAAGAQTVTPGIIANGNTLYAPAVTQAVTPGVISNAPTLYEPRLDLSVALGLISNGNTVLAPVVTVPQTVSLGLITNAPVLYEPRIDQAVVVGAITNAPTLFAPTVTQSVAVGIISNGSVVYAPLVDDGGVRLVSVDIVSHGHHVYAPVLTKFWVRDTLSPRRTRPGTTRIHGSSRGRDPGIDTGR